ncbi:acyltransferase family protein [Erwinia sp. OLCASP19]|uniref:acyltransferase family protein n=1 Tax=unclassified Erwinia TaxID=2622719 RepID=UPI00406D313E
MDPGIVIIPLSQQINIELNIAQYCKICVPIFLFLSGYGFAFSKRKSLTALSKKAVSIYSQAWLVALLFVPIGLLLFNDDGRYTLSLQTLLLNLSGLDTTWNLEWWFLFLYVDYLFSYPLLLKIPPLLLLTLSLVASVIGTRLYWYNFQAWYLKDMIAYLIWILPLTSGLMLGRHREQINTWLRQHEIVRRLMTPLCLVAIVVIGYGLSKYFFVSLCLMVPPLAFCIIQLHNVLPQTVRQVIYSLGHRSGFMWLTHSFYCYYFLQPFIYSPHYTLAIYALLIALSWLTSVIMSGLYTSLKKIVFPSSRPEPA